MHDNGTEHLRTINILERFNIYQEVILAALYRILPMQVCTVLSVRFMLIFISTQTCFHVINLFTSGIDQIQSSM